MEWCGYVIFLCWEKECMIYDIRYNRRGNNWGFELIEWGYKKNIFFFVMLLN